jgi:hypothetical protein
VASTSRRIANSTPSPSSDRLTIVISNRVEPRPRVIVTGPTTPLEAAANTNRPAVWPNGAFASGALPAERPAPTSRAARSRGCRSLSSSTPLRDTNGPPDRRGRVRLCGAGLDVLAPEDSATLRLLFVRGKDLVHVARLLAMMGPRLDRGVSRAQLVEVVGEDDSRVKEWDEVTPTVGA